MARCKKTFSHTWKQLIVESHTTIIFQIGTIDHEAFCCVPNLEHLSLSGNPLQRIDPDTLAGVRPTLRHLSLARANLTQLPGLQLPGLRTLDVSGNELTFVPPNTLVNLSEVRELDLSRNHLPTPPRCSNIFCLRIPQTNRALAVTDKT